MDPAERIDWLRSSSLPGVELLSAVNCGHAWSAFHERYAVCLPIRGGYSNWRYRGLSLQFYEQGLGLVEPGETHTTTAVHGPGDFFVVFVAPEVFLRAAQEQGHPGQIHFRLAQFEDWRLGKAVQGLAASMLNGDSTLAQQSWLAQCLHWMQAYAEGRPPRRSWHACDAAITRAKDCLRDRFRDQVDLEELTALTGLSRFALIHAFSSRVGVPPHTFQILFRIERARSLLQRGDHPASVASDLGFSDQSHFIRLFKRIMQVTPGQYASFMAKRK